MVFVLLGKGAGFFSEARLVKAATHLRQVDSGPYAEFIAKVGGYQLALFGFDQC